MHRFVQFITLFALVAHEVWGCCAHHSHPDERRATPSSSAACGCAHDGGALAGTERGLSGVVSHEDHAARDCHDQHSHNPCHETPCTYVAPNNSFAASDLGFDTALPVVLEDTAVPVKPSTVDDLPIRERLLNPRAHFLNQTLLL